MLSCSTDCRLMMVNTAILTLLFIFKLVIINHIFDFFIVSLTYYSLISGRYVVLLRYHCQLFSQ